MAPSSKKTNTPAAKPTEKLVNPPPPTTPGNVETTALARNMEQAVAPTGAMPAWLAAKAGAAPRGYDQMDSADFILPRLVLAQSMTPEVANAKDNGLGIEVGDIFDNLTKQVLCKAGEDLEIIPVILGKSRMYFGDYDKDEGILCRADDAITARPNGIGKDEGDQPTRECAKCVFREFDEEEGKPACSIFYNIIVLLPAFGMTAYVWSNKHVNVKVAKRFLSTSRQLRTDMFAQRYALRSVTEKNSRYTFQNFEFKPLGWVTQDQYQQGERFFASLDGKTWSPSTEDMEREIPSPTREPGSDDGDGDTTHATAPAAAAREEDAF